jgi:hypothetical protein
MQGASQRRLDHGKHLVDHLCEGSYGVLGIVVWVILCSCGMGADGWNALMCRSVGCGPMG